MRPKRSSGRRPIADGARGTVRAQNSFRGARTNTTTYVGKCCSELCRNCVRSPRNHRQIPLFTGLHREGLCGGKSFESIARRSVSVSLGERWRSRFPSVLLQPLGHLSVSFESYTYRPPVWGSIANCDTSSNLSQSLTVTPLRQQRFPRRHRKNPFCLAQGGTDGPVSHRRTNRQSRQLSLSGSSPPRSRRARRRATSSDMPIRTLSATSRSK
jgi:hypothetical protein